MNRVIGRIGIPRSTFYRLKEKFFSGSADEKENWRAQAVRELLWLDVLERSGISEVSGRFSAEEWAALIASVNGESINFDPAWSLVIGQPNRLSDSNGLDLLAFNFTEWCKYNASEASNFGDPSVLASVVSSKIASLSSAGKYVVLRVALEFWEQKDIQKTSFSGYVETWGIKIGEVGKERR